ncbi:MAG TPA: hypothetical protein ENN41_10415 [Sediminispirochaeta sp.]|nr:hypothetical protein [Sediminispirochaeta sp.]
MLRQKKYSAFTTLLFSLIPLILLAGCNKDGVGIFYQIGSEVPQNKSTLSERVVHQVLDVGGDIYVLSGQKVFVQSGDDWDDVSGGYLFTSIVTDGTDLFATSDSAQILSYEGSAWNEVKKYGDNVLLREANGAFVLKVGSGGIASISTSIGTVATEDFKDSEIDADTYEGQSLRDAAWDGAHGFVALTDKLLGTVFGAALSEQAAPDINGDFRGLATDGTDFYLSTGGGELYVGSLDNDSWTWEEPATSFPEVPVKGALEVVNLDGTKYLLIGTDEGYYEMKLGDSSVVPPSETTTVGNFSSSYPELARATIFDIYQVDGSTNEFYLATSAGLWLRRNDGTFARQ